MATGRKSCPAMYSHSSQKSRHSEVMRWLYASMIQATLRLESLIGAREDCRLDAVRVELDQKRRPGIGEGVVKRHDRDRDRARGRLLLENACPRVRSVERRRARAAADRASNDPRIRVVELEALERRRVDGLRLEQHELRRREHLARDLRPPAVRGSHVSDRSRARRRSGRGGAVAERMPPGCPLRRKTYVTPARVLRSTAAILFTSTARLAPIVARQMSTGIARRASRTTR